MCKVFATTCPDCTDARVLLMQLQEAFIMSDARIMCFVRRNRKVTESSEVPPCDLFVQCPLCLDTGVIVAQDGQDIGQVIDDRRYAIHKK